MVCILYIYPVDSDINSQIIYSFSEDAVGDSLDSFRTVVLSGRSVMSLNAHCGPVDFLMSISSTLASDLLRRDSVLNGSEEGNVGRDEGGQRLEHSSYPQDSQTPPPTEEKPKRLLLQYRLHSTCQLPGKVLTAQPEQGSPRAPHDSLEHSQNTAPSMK